MHLHSLNMQAFPRHTFFFPPLMMRQTSARCSETGRNTNIRRLRCVERRNTPRASLRSTHPQCECAASLVVSGLVSPSDCSCTRLKITLSADMNRQIDCKASIDALQIKHASAVYLTGKTRITRKVTRGKLERATGSTWLAPGHNVQLVLATEASQLIHICRHIISYFDLRLRRTTLVGVHFCATWSQCMRRHWTFDILPDCAAEHCMRSKML